MIHALKKSLLKITPHYLRSLYYASLANIGSMVYGFPSRNMIIIGITGTKGKTSTANFIWSCLNAGGIKTGIISTANIRIGDTENLNYFHMTMPGRFAISKLMKSMHEQGCKACVIEVTSEGIKQKRHVGIEFDFAVFTNLTPEHLPSHNNSFEEYKSTKGELFRGLKGISNKNKILDGMEIKKTIITNKDSEHADYFLSFNADKKITYGISSGDVRAHNISESDRGVGFENDGVPYQSPILGGFSVYNMLPAIIVGKELGISLSLLQQGISHLKSIPGRMEIIENTKNIMCIVDYAHEGQSMQALLTSAQKLKKSPQSKILVLLGAEGGGRDKAKRPIMGNIVGRLADFVVVSNVDPYEDDPKEIIEDIVNACLMMPNKILGQNVFSIEDRRMGIAKILSLAQSGDIVLITGKGAEQSMIIGGKKVDWDDRTVVREELSKL